MTNTEQMENNQQQDSCKETIVFDGWDCETFFTLLRLWEKKGESDDDYLQFTISEFIEEASLGEIKNFRPIIIYDTIDHIIKSLQKLPSFVLQSGEMKFHLVDNYSIVKKESNPDFLCKVKISNEVVEVLKSNKLSEAVMVILEWIRNNHALGRNVPTFGYVLFFLNEFKEKKGLKSENHDDIEKF